MVEGREEGAQVGSRPPPWGGERCGLTKDRPALAGPHSLSLRGAHSALKALRAQSRFVPSVDSPSLVIPAAGLQAQGCPLSPRQRRGCRTAKVRQGRAPGRAAEDHRFQPRVDARRAVRRRGPQGPGLGAWPDGAPPGSGSGAGPRRLGGGEPAGCGAAVPGGGKGDPRAGTLAELSVGRRLRGRKRRSPGGAETRPRGAVCSPRGWAVILEGGSL